MKFKKINFLAYYWILLETLHQLTLQPGLTTKPIVQVSAADIHYRLEVVNLELGSKGSRGYI